MKKYMFLYYGFVTPTQEIGKAWGEWFASIGDKMVDSGNPFMVGLEITPDGTTTQLPLDKQAITGYSIINAKDIEEAEAIAKTNPSITSIRVYEMGAM